MKRLELLIAAFFYYSGLVKLALWWTRRSGPRLVILCYHHGTGANFRAQLRYLNRHYRILHYEEAARELYASPSSGQRGDDRIMMSLTFDDGYHDNYTEGLTIARETRTPMTIFLVPGYIESGRRYWWDEPQRLVQHAREQKVTIDGRTFYLDKEDERQALTQTIEAHLRLSSSVAAREEFLDSLRKALDAPATPDKEDKDEQASLPLTWSEIHTMEESGWISFGGHTMHHPVLGYLADGSEVATEVREGHEVLEAQLKHPVSTFAFPYGRLKHIGRYGRQAVQDAGYSYAVTTIHGINSPQTDPLVMHRVLVGADQHWLVVAAKASGVWEFFLRRAARQEEIYG